jgi:hypothetical protein
MAKGPTSDAIMPPEKMKPLLALSKQDPVQAAIGLTAEGDGLILLDKRAKPKKVLSMLRAAAGKAKLQLNNASLRFGRAEVDTDYDSGMVRFFVNKETPGNMRVKLVEVVKRIPYQKVEINVDPSLEEEAEEGEAQETAPSPTSGTAPEAPPPAPPPPPPMDPGQAEGALRQALAGLIARIPGAAGNDAGRKATLLKVAGMANDQLKGHDAAAAGRTIARLREVLDAAPGGAATPAMAAWKAARGQAVAGLNAIVAEVSKMDFVDAPEAIILLRAIAMNLTEEPATRQQVAELRRYLEEDENVAEAEEPNGFGIELDLRGPLLAALAGLEAGLPG